MRKSILIAILTGGISLMAASTSAQAGGSAIYLNFNSFGWLFSPGPAYHQPTYHPGYGAHHVSPYPYVSPVSYVYYYQTRPRHYYNPRVYQRSKYHRPKYHRPTYYRSAPHRRVTAPRYYNQRSYNRDYYSHRQQRHPVYNARSGSNKRYVAPKKQFKNDRKAVRKAPPQRQTRFSRPDRQRSKGYAHRQSRPDHNRRNR